MSDNLPKEFCNDAIVSYIDVLGFKGKIDECDTPDKLKCFSNQHEDIFYALLSQQSSGEVCPANSNVNFSNKFFTEFSFYSDSITRIKPSDSDNLSQNILSEITEIARAQFDLITKPQYKDINYFIRGGITYGLVFYRRGTGNIIQYGKAFNDAYTIESKEAKLPLVMLDKKLVDKIGAERLEDYTYDIDQKFYIDYLKINFIHNPELMASCYRKGREKFIQRMKTHNKKIELFLEDNKNENYEIRNKFEKLKIYQNNFLEEYKLNI